MQNFAYRRIVNLLCASLLWNYAVKLITS